MNIKSIEEIINMAKPFWAFEGYKITIDYGHMEVDYSEAVNEAVGMIALEEGKEGELPIGWGRSLLHEYVYDIIATPTAGFLRKRGIAEILGVSSDFDDEEVVDLESLPESIAESIDDALWEKTVAAGHERDKLDVEARFEAWNSFCQKEDARPKSRDEIWLELKSEQQR